MGDIKTTVSGIIGGVAALLAIFNVVLPKEAAEIIAALAVIGIGYFAKDRKNEPAK